jgi:hypothetical protein
MNIKKIFTPKQSLFVIIIIAIISIIGFFWTQKEVIKLNETTIEQEIIIQKNITTLLVRLKATLEAPDKKEIEKITESFQIIAEIQELLDKEYKNLKKESQMGVDKIREKLTEIEQKLLTNPNEAIKLVDDLIQNIEESKGLEEFNKKSSDENINPDNPDNTIYDNILNDPNITDGTKPDPDTNTNNTNNQDTINNQTTSTSTSNLEDLISPFYNFTNYKQGIRPKVDRNYSEEVEGVTIPFNTKIGI